MATGIGAAPVFAFYAQAYQILRGISGTGPGNGPMIMLGEGFIGALRRSPLLTAQALTSTPTSFRRLTAWVSTST